jgi:hypothetical protein
MQICWLADVSGTRYIGCETDQGLLGTDMMCLCLGEKCIYLPSFLRSARVAWGWEREHVSQVAQLRSPQPRY